MTEDLANSARRQCTSSCVIIVMQNRHAAMPSDAWGVLGDGGGLPGVQRVGGKDLETMQVLCLNHASNNSGRVVEKFFTLQFMN